MSEMAETKKMVRSRPYPLEAILRLRFVDDAGRVFALDYGKMRGEYILRELTKSEMNEHETV